MRVSLNSAVKDLYEAYYKPVKYGWEDVEASIALARERGAYLALNLLLFPGVTDREGEVEALERLVEHYQVDQVQTRSLCIDPLQYLEVARETGRGRASRWALAACCEVLKEGGALAAHRQLRPGTRRAG